MVKETLYKKSLLLTIDFIYPYWRFVKDQYIKNGEFAVMSFKNRQYNVNEDGRSVGVNCMHHASQQGSPSKQLPWCFDADS